MRIIYLFGLSLLAGCGGEPVGGSCLLGNGTCYMVTSPADHAVKLECDVVSGTWSQSACDKKKFERKCTQTSKSGSTDVTTVYYFPAGLNVACDGTEETL